ncbi:MAG TPA: dihydrolipoamide acetyltransferase family protein [Clostridia bacterium]|nr:dihydrolipoamide acetyltransferase family protein [Clostridia bacterium]
MATTERMPKFGLSMEEGVLTEWLVPVGGTVRRGEPIAVIEAEKLTNDALASTDGIMLRYYLQPGESAPCGAPICLVGIASEETGDARQPVSPAQADPPQEPEAPEHSNTSTIPATPRAKAVIAARALDAENIPATGRTGEITIDDVRLAAQSPAPSTPGSPVRITPRARMLADKLRLSCSHIRGTGLLNMVTVADVRAHGRPAAQARVIPMNGIQRATAAAMKKSLENAAQTAVCVESGFAPLVAAYRRLKPIYAAEGIKLSYTAMILHALSRALARREDVRMQYSDGKNFILPAGVHIGVAIDTEKGLLVPAVRDADQKTLRALCIDLEDLAARAKAGKLTEGDFGGTVTTVTNLAMAGVTLFTPILNPPETTILGVCKLRDMPVARDGDVFIEPVMNLCLTYDHRALNGAPAGRFLNEVIGLLNGTDWQ